ncbi:tellurite resistance TerB family protein [Ahrensia marina]|uniref:tellurite resistance TerB family protein n=1 Tax=Ahrensia marina TaxID=1514904 RepID=UPI0035D0F878
MRDAKALLDQFLGQVDLSSVTGQQPGSGDASAQQGGATSGLNLDSLLSGRGGLATGAVAGGLAGLLLGGKKGRKLAGGALKVGGAALVGGLAYKAWKDYQAGQNPGATPPTNPPAGGGGGSAAPLPIEDASGTGFLPDDAGAQERLSQSLIAAMIGAAKADGHVTEEERTRIGSALEKLTIEGDQRAFIQEELSKPLDVGAIASMASSEEHKVEIYAASLIAVDPDGPAEKGYLAMLAARLGLDPKLVEHLHANADKLLVDA